MCRVLETKKFRKPNKDKVFAYKVFDRQGTTAPRNFCGDAVFPIDEVITWDEDRAKNDGYGDQKGFQMFAYKKDALKYATSAGYRDFVCKVEIETKNIATVGKFWIGDYVKAYEVRKFKIENKNWKQKFKTKK